VTSSEDVKNALDEATAELGPAGHRVQQRRHRAADRSDADITEEEWNRIPAVNFSGVSTAAEI
jgi:hypothetical protein